LLLFGSIRLVITLTKKYNQLKLKTRKKSDINL
jgi:hypothetical protein